MGHLLQSLQYTFLHLCENSPKFAQVTNNIKIVQVCRLSALVCPSDTLLPILLITLVTSIVQMYHF